MDREGDRTRSRGQGRSNVSTATKAGTDGHPRSRERTVSLGTCRGRRPCPQVDARPPELRGGKTQPPEAGQRAGGCEAGSRLDPSNSVWRPAQSQCSPSWPASRPCLPALLGHLGHLGACEGTKDPSASRGPDTGRSKLRSPARHQVPCWAPSQCPLNPTGRKREHDLLAPRQLHGPGCLHGPRPRGHPPHPCGTAPRAVSPGLAAPGDTICSLKRYLSFRWPTASELRERTWPRSAAQPSTETAVIRTRPPDPAGSGREGPPQQHARGLVQAGGGAGGLGRPQGRAPVPRPGASKGLHTRRGNV